MSKTIQLKTTIPGPRSLGMLELRNQHVPKGISNSTPLFIERASGAVATDVDGNVLLDFAGGIGTMNVGHCNPDVVRAATEQLNRFTHTCFSVAMYESYAQLAAKLNAITPGNFPKKTMLSNSGAEAIENAVKIARHHTKRSGVVVFEHAFHGRTLLTMSMTSKVKPYKHGFGPFAPEIYRLPYPYEYRNQTIDLDEFFSAHVAADSVACVVIEPVLGEGGFVPAPKEFLQNLERVCRQHGILLVADEVQTGFARTGKMFACEHSGIEPDITVMAKSLAGGFPLSAITGRSEIMDSSQVGGLGGTFAGNPVSCAAALAAIEFIERENLVARAAEIGSRIQKRFTRFFDLSSAIGDVRGLGAMMALEFVKDRKSKEPDKDRASQIIRRCYENGLIVLAAGTYGNVIRTLMPLVITNDQLDEGLSVMEHALE